MVFISWATAVYRTQDDKIAVELTMRKETIFHYLDGININYF